MKFIFLLPFIIFFSFAVNAQSSIISAKLGRGTGKENCNGIRLDKTDAQKSKYGIENSTNR